MFADSLLESNLDRRNRGWTTLASFAMQTLGMAILLMLPLLYTEGLPKLHLVSVSAPIGPPRGEPPATQQHARRSTTAKQSVSRNCRFATSIPIGVEADHRRLVSSSGGLQRLRARRHRHREWREFRPEFRWRCARDRSTTTASHGSSAAHLPHDGGQPHLQSAAGVSALGTRGTNSRSGCDSGGDQPQRDHCKSADPKWPPHAGGAALDAVRQWRYRPYILNGDPVEVETQVTVNFSLSGG